jgi:hypothetical protein
MSKMFLKYTESWHINVNAVASMTGNGRNKLRKYKLFKSEYGCVRSISTKHQEKSDKPANE